MNLQNIKTAIAEKVPEEALEILDSLLAETPENADLLVERGKIHWKLGHRAEAMSDYRHAARLDPDGPARLLSEHSSAIMDFFNPDLLNP